ncbi:DNA polymerase III subunit beta [Pseudobacteroides cellulosolvens]|uniref:Beta sliding clamp n=1 Tax=Pseudobacteroides cellulosolvens ATCC 35603 = DSM 2933 TaxID=398512 RepID=A0A0L6JV71_9FIRM|nr:DNA polymerase III subunit beta [Pseudobacteroides cellulosolvens]KNY29741.1 DNA polymerase III, beta subunit [Pseudobacteroides cellulosolvens ATCC 35603 = DSM 2933]
MKVICSKEKLLEGINIVQKAVSTKSTMQILEGILLKAGNNFKLTGNDLEIGIECTIEADIRREGSIVINSKMLGDIVRKLPESEILIEVKDNGKVIIECENSHFEIKGIPSEGYPELQMIENENMFVSTQNILRDMIRQTIFAVGFDDNRPVLKGILIESNGKELDFVAIDGFRMAQRRRVSEEEFSLIKVIVPGKTMNEIVKILQPEDEEMKIISSKNHVLFDLNNVKILSRIIEGEYLDYKSIIPSDYDTEVIVEKKEFLSSLERASLISNEEKKYPLKFDIEDEKIILSSSTELGTVREEIRVEMTGRKMEIGFNPRYFIEALKAIDEERIKIVFTSEIGPSTIFPISGEEFAYMVLPVRMNKDT